MILIFRTPLRAHGQRGVPLPFPAVFQLERHRLDGAGRYAGNGQGKRFQVSTDVIVFVVHADLRHRPYLAESVLTPWLSVLVCLRKHAERAPGIICPFTS
ncbi:hypothetical protein D3C72_1909770 [compost metagenome]